MLGPGQRETAFPGGEQSKDEEGECRTVGTREWSPEQVGGPTD